MQGRREKGGGRRDVNGIGGGREEKDRGREGDISPSRKVYFFRGNKQKRGQLGAEITAFRMRDNVFGKTSDVDGKKGTGRKRRQVFRSRVWRKRRRTWWIGVCALRKAIF